MVRQVKFTVLLNYLIPAVLLKQACAYSNIPVL